MYTPLTQTFVFVKDTVGILVLFLDKSINVFVHTNFIQNKRNAF